MNTKSLSLCGFYVDSIAKLLQISIMPYRVNSILTKLPQMKITLVFKMASCGCCKIDIAKLSQMNKYCYIICCVNSLTLSLPIDFEK